MWFSFSSAVKCPPVLDPLQAPQPIVEEASVDIDISGLFLDIGAELFLILSRHHTSSSLASSGSDTRQSNFPLDSLRDFILNLSSAR